jgi:hypothetical protein
MLEELSKRENKIREFFGLAPETKLLEDDAVMPDVTPPMAAHLAQFNIEWHVIPSEKVVPFDDNYIKRLYPRRARDFAFSHQHHGGVSLRESLAAAHQRHQGKIIGIETTVKPDYLPGNHQFYGTPYGFDPTADPFSRYIGRAGFTSGTRFAHNYASLKNLGDQINADWRARSLMPSGYRLTICPPLAFNLIGSIFHREWSETKSLELAAYRDDHGNAVCYAVGANSAGDFSYVQRVETDSDWTLLGFRAALVPDRGI